MAQNDQTRYLSGCENGGTLVALVHHRRARVTSHCAPFSPMCASTYELHMPQCPRRGPNGSPQSPKMALYWLKVGPKWSQNRSALRKTVQNCAKWVKLCQNWTTGCRMGAPLVLIRQIWPEKGPKGPFSAKFVRFSLLTLPQKG